MSRLRARRGYALLTATAVITCMAILGASLLSMAGASGRIATRRRQNAEALQLAMGGVDLAVRRLKDNQAYTGFAAQALGGGTLALSVSTPASNADRRIVTSTGVVSGGAYAVTRTIRGTMDLGVIPPLFYNALAARESFILNGNITTGSTPTPAQGNVHCNQNVTITGTSGIVDGRVTATGSVITSGTPTVTGGLFSGMPLMDFPVIDSNFQAKALLNGATTGSVSVSDGRLIQGKINGNLTVGTPNGCKVTGVVWVTGTVTVTGPVTGKGTIVANSTMALDARNDYPVGDLNNVAYITTSTATPAVTLGGNRQFKGIIYAPDGGVKLNGNPELIGSVLARAVEFNGNPIIRRWTDFTNDPIPLPSMFQLRGWEEP
jgi:hypothetical protein